MATRWTDCEGFHRRDFIKVGTAGLLGLTLPELLRLESQVKAAEKNGKKAASVIMIWLAGGPATIDMWDLKPDAPEGIRGEFKEIPTSVPGVKISEHLPKTASVLDHCTVVRSLYHNIAAHELGTVYMTTGNRPTPAMQYPSMGSLTSKLLPAEPGVPPYVVFGALRQGRAGLGGYLGTAYNPFEVEGDAGRGGGGGQLRVRGVSLPQGFSLDELENRNKLLEAFDAEFKALDKSADLAAGMDKFQEQALEILRSNKTKQAFDLNRESQSLRDGYGANPFGQGVLAARRLVEAGVRFVTVSLGGWDTHNQNFTALKTRLLPQLDQTLAALIKDLAEKGLLDSTVVYCAGEFNRTPKINARAGRDHWGRSMAVLLAGGGFKHGYCHGTTDASGMAPANDPCLPDDVSATIFHLLGLNPHQDLMTPSGRPIALFREGKVLNALLA